MANLIAARVGGANVFGTYALMISTANSIAAYAGAGIGQTATRFSCVYSTGTREYRRLVRLLTFFVISSVSIAMAIMIFAAKPMAVLLMKNPALAPLLRLSSLSAGAALAMECVRGILIGERRYKLMLVTAAIFAVGILLALPPAAHFGPRSMIVAQSSALFLAAVCCVFLAMRKTFASIRRVKVVTAPPSIKTFAGFGFTQLLQTFCMNTSGLWVTSMLARSDSTLVQLGFFAVASQIRNMTAMPSGLLTQSAFPLLTEEGGSSFGGSGTVLTRSTYFAVLLAVVCASVATFGAHLALPLLYGKTFAAAENATIFGIATALVHMSAAPAAARLTIVSLPASGFISAVWAVVVTVLAWIASPTMDAGLAMEIYFVAHSLSAVLVLAALRRAAALPRATAALTAYYLAASWTLVLLARWRSHLPALDIAGSVMMFVALTVLPALLFACGAYKNWIPKRFSLGQLRSAFVTS